MSRLPQLVVEGDSLPEVWEKSIIELRDKGISYKKESYRGVGEKLLEEEPIREASMLMVVRHPLQEPMLHMGCQGLGQLPEYVKEVIEGLHDDYVDKGFWDYTYHRLLAANDAGPEIVNQFDYIDKKLKEAPFSNRAQGTTWIPWKHTHVKGPPCLQRIWCKVIDDELEMHTSWRSRDAFDAAFLNMYAFIQLQKIRAEVLGYKVGQYVDYSDSYHFYSHKKGANDLEGFLNMFRTQGPNIRYQNSSLLKTFEK